MQKTISPKVLAYRIKLANRHPLSSMTPEEIVAEALKHKVYMAWSGGRCSTIALHFAIQQNPDIPVVFNNTGVEYPENVKYVRHMADKWDLNFHELKPEANFWELVKEHGFPQLRGSAATKKRRARKPACCTYLKEAPANKFMKDHEMVGYITGLRVEESRPRALVIFQKGPFYKAIRDGIWRFHPVALWNLETLMKYAKDQNIPLNPLYAQGLPRVGCRPCTGFIGWRQQLSVVNPRFFKWLNREYQKSQGEPTLWEFEDRYDPCIDNVAITGIMTKPETEDDG